MRRRRGKTSSRWPTSDLMSRRSCKRELPATGSADQLRQKENASDPKAVAAAVSESLASVASGGSFITAPVVYSSQVLSSDLKQVQRQAARLLAATSPWDLAAAWYDIESLP